MPGIQHSRLTRQRVDELIVQYASASYPFDVREYAVRTALSFNELQTTPLSETAFEAAVTTLHAKLIVAMPTVPVDLATLSDAEAVALADALELAQWDFNRRTAAMGFNLQYWQKRGVVPTAGQYLDMFYRVANFARGVRSLTNLS